MGFSGFKEIEDETFLLTSIAEDHDILANTFTKSYLNLYSFDIQTKHLKLVNSTPLESICTAFFPFKGKLLASVGGHLRLYQLGKK